MSDTGDHRLPSAADRLARSRLAATAATAEFGRATSNLPFTLIL